MYWYEYLSIRHCILGTPLIIRLIRFFFIEKKKKTNKKDSKKNSIHLAQFEPYPISKWINKKFKCAIGNFLFNSKKTDTTPSSKKVSTETKMKRKNKSNARKCCSLQFGCCCCCYCCCRRCCCCAAVTLRTIFMNVCVGGCRCVCCVMVCCVSVWWSEKQNELFFTSHRFVLAHDLL